MCIRDRSSALVVQANTPIPPTRMAANTPVMILRTVRFLTLVAVLVEPIETKLRGPSPAPRKNGARPRRDAPRGAVQGESRHGNRWNWERHRRPLAAGERPLSVWT